MSDETDNRILEVYRQLSQSQEKYTFYVTALCVSAIGFSVYCTMGKPLSNIHYPLGAAIISWALSIFCGLKYVEKTMNAKFFNLEKLQHSLKIGTMSSEEYQNRQLYFQEMIKTNTTKSRQFSVVQEYTFYSGVVFFIIWHILEMYYTK